MKKNAKLIECSFAKYLVLLFVLSYGSQITQAQLTPNYSHIFDSLVIKPTHPRIWIDDNKITFLKNKCLGKTSSEVLQMAGHSITGMALTCLITGDEKIGKMAIEKALGKYVNPGSSYPDLNTPDGENKRVHYQPTLVEQALCYDWCYPLLSVEEKLAFRNSMVPKAQKHIDFRRAWRSFHNGMYDNAWPATAVTLALYGEDPFAKDALAFLIPEFEDMMKTFDILFPDGEWPEGMDYNRHSTYPAIRILKALQTASGKNFMQQSPHLRNTGAYIIYSIKPNGLALPSDDNDWPYLGSWEREALLILNDEFKDGYNQYFLNHSMFPRFQFEPNEKYNDLLWYNASIKEKPLTDLPLSKIFRGKGLVLARSGWQFNEGNKKSSDTWINFHCGDYLGDHVHYDVNSFTISRKSELALDAGRYDTDWGIEDWRVSKDSSKIQQSQFFNYYRRTIAHNTILVYDPNERMPMNLLNDGGQIDQLRRYGPRNVPEDYEQGNYPSEEGIGKCDWATNPGRWETGDIKSYKATRDFMYVKGDGTKAYASTKMDSYIRQLFFLQPNIVVVMDRVVSTNPNFKKTWLLHSINEPKISNDGRSFEIDNGVETLFCTSILPKQVRLNNIGGLGNGFILGQAILKYGLDSHIEPAALHYGETPGDWRIEENPVKAAKEDYFLNIIQVGDKESKEKLSYKVLADNTDEIIILVKLAGNKQAKIIFTKGINPSAKITISTGTKIWVKENMPDKIVLEKRRLN